MNKHWLLFTFPVLLGSACTEPPPPTLGYKEREIVDNLFREKADSLKPIIDSLCNARFDSLVQRNVDSMMEVRTTEIQKYLERLRKEAVRE